jgi:hypothetical protein
MPRNPLSQKCHAHSSRTGAPCRRPAIQGGTVCTSHGGAIPNVRAAAERRIQQLILPALATIAQAIRSFDSEPAVAVAAARDVLDRAGYKTALQVESSGGMSIQIEYVNRPVRTDGAPLVDAPQNGRH